MMYAKFKQDVTALMVQNYFRGDFSGEHWEFPKKGDVFSYSTIQKIHINQNIGKEAFITIHNSTFPCVTPGKWVRRLKQVEFEDATT